MTNAKLSFAGFSNQPPIEATSVLLSSPAMTEEIHLEMHVDTMLNCKKKIPKLRLV